MPNYAIYLRKSRADVDAEARGEGETLAKHRTALRALAERRGLNVVREYAEIITGDSIAGRPQMQQLLEDVKRGMYDGVIVNDIDRLGRGDSIDQEIIKYTFAASHCIIITPTKDIDPASQSGEDVLDFSMFLARFEYKISSRRLMQGRIRSAEAGSYIHSRIPFGYMRVKDGKMITLVPDPETAPIVKMMFEMYGNKLIGYGALTRKLNEMGIKTTRGYQFYPNTVRNILTNPVYIGTNIWGKTKTVVTVEDGKKVKHTVATNGPIVVENAHQPIIDRELFDRVQNIFKENKRMPRANKNKPVSNPLASLVHCSVCGMCMQQANSRRDKALICLTFGCPTVGAPVYVVEREVLSVLRSWCATYKDIEDEPPKEDTERTAALQKQLQTINSRLAKARELVELGVYSPSEYSEQKTMLTKQADTIQREIAENAYPPTTNAIKNILPEIENVLDAYQYAQTGAEKNELLRSIIARVDYEKTQKARGKQKPAELMKLVVYPRLSK